MPGEELDGFVGDLGGEFAGGGDDEGADAGAGEFAWRCNVECLAGCVAGEGFGIDLRKILPSSSGCAF